MLSHSLEFENQPFSWDSWAKLPFVSRIELIRSKLVNFSVHVSCIMGRSCVHPYTPAVDKQASVSVSPDTWAEKFESFERINSIRETNGNFDSCNSCKRLVPSRLHELHESKFPFVSRIEFIRSKLSNFSAHVSGVGVGAPLIVWSAPLRRARRAATPAALTHGPNKTTTHDTPPSPKPRASDPQQHNTRRRGLGKPSPAKPTLIPPPRAARPKSPRGVIWRAEGVIWRSDGPAGVSGCGGSGGALVSSHCCWPTVVRCSMELWWTRQCTGAGRGRRIMARKEGWGGRSGSSAYQSSIVACSRVVLFSPTENSTAFVLLLTYYISERKHVMGK